MAEKGLCECDKGPHLSHVDKEGQLYSAPQTPSTQSSSKNIHWRTFYFLALPQDLVGQRTRTFLLGSSCRSLDD